MAKQATLEQWKELYQLTLDITKLNPWQYYSDSDLIAVETKQNSDPNFVSIMGKEDGCYGISTYLGMEGYSDFCQIYNSDYHLSPSFTLSDQNCLACFWGNRDEIDKETHTILQKLGIHFKGNGNWIYFKTFEKKYYPTLPNYGEVNILIDTYKGLLATLKNFEWSPTIYKHNEMIYTQKDEYLKWISYTVPYPLVPERYNTIYINNKDLINHFKTLAPSDIELALDIDYMMIPTTDKGFEKPINPLAFIFYDLKENSILHFDLIHPDDETYKIIMDHFLGTINHFGKPRHVYARNPYILHWLQFICDILNIELIQDDLEELDEIFEMLKQYTD